MQLVVVLASERASSDYTSEVKGGNTARSKWCESRKRFAQETFVS